MYGAAADPSIRALSRLDTAILENAGELDDPGRRLLLDDLRAAEALHDEQVDRCLKDMFGHPMVGEHWPRCTFPTVRE